MDISVIVPTLNEESYIEACLSSIYSQSTDFDFEVIVSDGDSEDGTSKIARQFADKVVVSRRRGTAIQRNLGAKEASTNHLLFIDADTVLIGDYLQRAHTKFLEDQKLNAFSSSFIFPERTPKLIFSERVMNSYFLVRDRLGRSTLPGFNVNIRKKVFDRIGGFRNVPLEDIDLSIRLRKIGNTKYFRDLHVITSSRRLDRMGLLGAIKYYIEMDLTRKNPSLKGFLIYGDYFSCRVKNSDIQGVFERAFKGIKSDVGIDLSSRNYIKERIEPLIKLKEVSPRELLKRIESTSISLADIGLKNRIEKIDVDNAMHMMKSKLRNLREKTRIKVR